MDGSRSRVVHQYDRFGSPYLLWLEKQDFIKDAQPHQSITRPDKFLKYGATGGWANQVLSLEHAIWLADATQRTLVVSPMLGFCEKFQSNYVNSGINEEYEKVTTYIPMSEVLELDWSGLNIVDWKVFYNRFRNNNTLKERELSHLFHCGNTKWTRNLTSWSNVNLTNIHTCKDHLGKKGIYNVTIQDMVTTLQPYDSYDILDFNFIFPSSNFDTAHQWPTFNLTYSEPIRAVAKLIRQNLWDDRPYAAIYIRGGEGPYLDIFSQNSSTVIHDSLVMAGSEIELYNKHNNHNLNNVTLLVVTDIQKIKDHKNWKKESALFTSMMAKKGISMSYSFRSDYKAQVNDFTANTSNPYADICVDMQLAACASAGFGYYKTNSTFLKRIVSMRMQPPVC